MEVEVRKIKDTESTPRSSIKPRLYDARMKNTHNLATEQNFKEQLRTNGSQYGPCSNG